MRTELLDGGLDADRVDVFVRVDALIREAVANIVSGTTRAGTFAVVLVLLLGALALVDGLNTARLAQDARAFRAAGAATLVISAAGAVDPVACEALADVDGVEAAGALRASRDEIVLSLLPASPVAVFEVSPRFASVVGVANGRADGALVSDEVITALGIGAGSWIATQTGSLHASGGYTYPADGRRPGLGWAALIPHPEHEPFDECWVSVWPYDDSLRQLLPATVDVDEAIAGGPSFTYDIAQLNDRLGATPSGTQTFANRVTAYAPIVAALLGGILGALAIHLRRREFASRLAHRARRTTVVGLAAIESLFWAGSGGGVVCLVVLLVAVGMPSDDGRAIAVTGALTAAVGVLAAVVGAMLRALTVRERDLFRYFREG